MKIVILARIRFAADAIPEVRAAVAAARAATLPEAGCIQYAFAEDLSDPGLLRVSEIWADRAALDAHIAAPHVAQWRTAVAAIGVIEREVRVFTIADEEAL
ncbi:MAG: putative quinol monooxygenase [Pseudomonadota bacterium]